MKIKDALEVIDYKIALDIIEEVTEEKGFDYNHVKILFDVIHKDPKSAPGNIGGKNDDEEVCIEKWVNKLIKGYQGRASKRDSKLSKTVPDPIIKKIIGSRLEELNSKDLHSIIYAHRLAMAAENIQGSLLEEYLAEKLIDYGWYCAWGETVKSVDFVSEDGELLQIKNRSNSENSSSSAVRNGTNIKKWYRIEANKVEYKWDDLNKMLGVDHLSEKKFNQFVDKVLKINPECLAIEEENPWLNEEK